MLTKLKRLVVVIVVMLTKFKKVLEQVQHSLSVAGESSRSVPGRASLEVRETLLPSHPPLPSPLPHAASQLMEKRAVRVLNTIVMGSINDTVIPKVGQWTLRWLTVLLMLVLEMALGLRDLHRTWQVW